MLYMYIVCEHRKIQCLDKTTNCGPLLEALPLNPLGLLLRLLYLSSLLLLRTADTAPEARDLLPSLEPFLDNFEHDCDRSITRESNLMELALKVKEKLSSETDDLNYFRGELYDLHIASYVSLAWDLYHNGHYSDALSVLSSVNGDSIHRLLMGHCCFKMVSQSIYVHKCGLLKYILTG